MSLTRTNLGNNGMVQTSASRHHHPADRAPHEPCIWPGTSTATPRRLSGWAVADHRRTDLVEDASNAAAATAAASRAWCSTTDPGWGPRRTCLGVFTSPASAVGTVAAALAGQAGSRLSPHADGTWDRGLRMACRHGGMRQRLGLRFNDVPVMPGKVPGALVSAVRSAASGSWASRAAPGAGVGG